MTSGTSFSAAYISGLAALMLERNPALKPDDLRAVVIKTARDLGPAGRDDLYGAGEADAYAAVLGVASARAATASQTPATEKASDRPQVPASRALDVPAPSMASEKPAAAEANRAAAQ
jgi:subtilisin family serine protease